MVRRGRALRRLTPLLAPMLLAAVLWLLHRELAGVDLRDIRASLWAIAPWRLLVAVACTVLGFMALSAYDSLGFRLAGERIAWPRIALASGIGYAFSQALGHALLTGIPIRLRLYSAWKVPGEKVGRVMVFGLLSFWLGNALLAGLLFVVEPLPLPGYLAPLTVRPLGWVLLAAVGGYLALVAGRGKVLEIGGLSFRFPNRRVALAQIAIAWCDLAFAASVLRVLLPDAGSSLPRFLAAFLLANMLGVLSTLPGGVGVFDATLVFLLPSVPRANLLGAVLVYRAIYYLLPLIAATVAISAFELSWHRKALKLVSRFAGRWNAVVAPHVLAAATFVGGAVLLFSGSTPAVGSRLALLGRLLPLPVIETSHFLGSSIGLLLLVLARGLQRRVHAAYQVTVVLLAMGIVVSLLKGLDVEEAAILGVMLAALIASRRRFERRASIAAARLTPAWIGAIGTVLVLASWLMLFSHRHVAYSGELWWRFSLSGDAPRTLRAMAGVSVLTVAMALARWLRPYAPAPTSPSREVLDRAWAIARHSSRTYPQLVALGDKSVLFDPSQTGFLMYAVERRSWVALGDPVAEEAVWPELLWRFQGMAERAGGWPVFYQVNGASLEYYVELGLSFAKLGEEALVPLATFSLEGAAYRSLRHTVRRLSSGGYLAEVLAPSEVTALLPRLRTISDAWLATRSASEKGFSLGFFEPAYLERCALAVVRSPSREVVAFTNLLQTEDRRELSVDLMRFGDDAPNGTMDLLFVEVMRWGQAHGYQTFSLGMAPLSGIDPREGAPLWGRLSAVIYRHGEHFYNFRGLRQYKEKFRPRWEPRYLASPGGLVLPRILTNVASLIAGGVRGILT